MVNSSRMKGNVFLLAVGQAVMMSGTVLLFATAALLGSGLASDKALATLPLALQMAASVATTIPAALLMARIGRRNGFLLASSVAVTGAVLATYAIVSRSFELFCLAAALIGVFTGFGNYFRFAAVDAAPLEFRARAVSYVLAGGVAAAVIGPNLARWGSHLLPGVAFAGGYVALAMLYLLCFFLMFLLDIPRVATAVGDGGRPLLLIVRQPAVLVAMIAGALGYGMMALIMTAAPLAMHGYAHHYDDTAFVIEWHVLGMFVPSFVTGRLIHRFGVGSVMLVGALLMAGCVAVNLLGTSVHHFWLALLCLGIGWNFLFIGATSLLTVGYWRSEQAKVQALNDFVVFGVSTLAVLSAGALQYRFGWQAVNLGVIPCIAIVLAALGWLRRTQQRRCAVDDFAAAGAEG